MKLDFNTAKLFLDTWGMSPIACQLELCNSKECVNWQHRGNPVPFAKIELSSILPLAVYC
jgi:hypothetical protein